MINDVLLRDITIEDIELEEKYHQEYQSVKNKVIVQHVLTLKLIISL